MTYTATSKCPHELRSSQAITHYRKQIFYRPLKIDNDGFISSSVVQAIIQIRTCPAI